MRRRASTPSATPEPVTVRVAGLGAEGDGIAALADGSPAYVPLALPGELVRARPLARRGAGWAAALEGVLEPSAERAVPGCPHFGACGGCVAQHMGDPAYLAWKSAELGAALRRAGFADPPLTPPVRTAPGTRRRMDLAIRRVGNRWRVGLHRRRSGEVVDLDECLVLHPALAALIAPLRGLGPSGVRREGSVIANLLDNGPDLLLRTDAPLTLADRVALTAFARAHGLSRVSWALRDAAPEPVCVLRTPEITLSGVAVSPPPGAFLQATGATEAAITAAVLAGLPETLPARARLTELYAGCGTLTFALAQRAKVRAWEGDPDALAALAAAARLAGLSGRIEARPRDLARQPLSAAELAGSAAVVLDPPHAGAPAQMAGIAAARAPRVVYVSCNPAALSRDARPLAAAGYRVERVTPIDQFLWSARIESVLVFSFGG
ncbi:MAG: class I SAM-dependent RNA methyltransferase [Acetobacteraceae bacterium]|nr:class I SAM-dependent RNA methyltransferase [Acetobacteraceae bacterium]